MGLGFCVNSFSLVHSCSRHSSLESAGLQEQIHTSAHQHSPTHNCINCAFTASVKAISIMLLFTMTMVLPSMLTCPDTDPSVVSSNTLITAVSFFFSSSHERALPKFISLTESVSLFSVCAGL